MGDLPQNKIHKSLLSALGKSKDSPEFSLVRKLLGDPSLASENDSIISYSFAQSGNMFTYMKALASFVMVSFHFKTSSVAEGSFSAYSSDLPAGILPLDGLVEISQKLGTNPISDHHDLNNGNDDSNDEPQMDSGYFEVPPYRIGYTLESVTGPLVILCVNLLDFPKPAKWDRNR
jgi:hypothetical protein